MYCRLLTLSIFTTLILSCGSGPTGEVYNLKGFQTESIGGGAEYASFQDQQNWPLTSGHVINGVRNGLWTTYHPTSNKINTLTNYINGKKNGQEIILNDRGYVESVISYRNDQLHGLTARYKNGRTLSETTYANGVMDGLFAVYDTRGKVQRSGSFKNGKQDGELLFYNEDGEITMRYQYENGEKISGGIVDE